jgi:hypothetical protein
VSCRREQDVVCQCKLSRSRGKCLRFVNRRAEQKVLGKERVLRRERRDAFYGLCQWRTLLSYTRQLA